MPDHDADINSAAVQTYLTLLQGTVARMANNSASCKTWCVTIVAAVLAVAITSNRGVVAFAATLPVVIFSLLDAFYLSLEHDYIRLYNEFVSDLRTGHIDEDDIFRMSPSKSGSKRLKSTLEAFGSVSVWPVYAVILLAVTLTGVLLG